MTIKGPSIFNKAKVYFDKIGVSVNDAQLRNTVTTIFTLLREEEILIDILLEKIYPKSEFKEENNE